jgi:predicted RNase H-like HicB family nuclease
MSDGHGRMGPQFDILIDRDCEGYLVASVPQLPGCHTQARSLVELKARIREAIQCYTGSDEESDLIVTSTSKA